MDNSGSAASNSPSSAIQTINIFLLQSDDTLIHILQDVILWGPKNNEAVSVYAFTNNIQMKQTQTFWNCLPGR